jgi:hypothetical protein
VEKARAFYRLIGTEEHFKPELWRQVEPPRASIIPLSRERLHDSAGVFSTINFRPLPISQEMPGDQIKLAAKYRQTVRTNAMLT